MENKSILIVVGGGKQKLDSFAEAAKKMKINITCASLSDLNYFSDDRNQLKLMVGSQDVANFDTVYVRMVGERLEDLTLLAEYAKEHQVEIIDRLYQKALLMPTSISKAKEMKHLIDAGIPLPKTIYGRLRLIRERAPKYLGYPFIIKTTSGKKARDVWSPKSEQEFDELFVELRNREKAGTRFFAQQFVRASQRIRALVIGGQAVAAITRPTKYRKRFMKKVKGEFPEGIKGEIKPIPGNVAKLAVSATKAVSLDIAGVDIMIEDKSKKAFVLEVNAAPSWKLIAKDCHLNVEEEILKFLISN